jgi:hypothetical protein
VKKNRFNKILKHLKSTELDEKIKRLNESPTNSMSGVYSLNAPGFRLGGRDDQDPTKIYYPDVDGNWPAGIPGTPGELEYIRPGGYWSGDSDWETQVSTDFSQDYLLSDPTGRNTSDLIGPDGTVFSALPPGGESFILGPLIDGFVPNHTSDAYTNIGYIQKDTRQFVLLARISGQWKNGLNGSNFNVWNGTSTGLTIYNQYFTLEMAQWIRDKILADSYVVNVPYFYSGGVPQIPQSVANCPNCPPGMYGGNGIGPRQFGSGGDPSIGTQQSAPTKGGPEDAGYPWGLISNIASLLGGAVKTVSDILDNILQAPANVLEYVFSNIREELIADAIKVAGKITGLESSANMLNAYQSFLGNPNSAGSSPSNPYDATSDIGTADMQLLSNKIYGDPSVNELLDGLQKGSYSSEKITIPDYGTFSEVDVKTSVLESRVHNAVNIAVDQSLGLNNSLHNNVQANVQKSIEKGEIVLTKEYVFRSGGSVEAAEKTIIGQVLSALGVELDTAGGGGGLMTYVGFAAAALGLSNSRKYGDLYNSPGMHYQVIVPPPLKLKTASGGIGGKRGADISEKKLKFPQKEAFVLSENRRKILREIKKPVKIEEPLPQKLKNYRPNFAGKYTPQNTPDVTASKESDDMTKAKNAAGQTWRLNDKHWSRYESAERMNIVYDNIGHGSQYWDMIVNQNKRDIRDKAIQEYRNIIAHNKAMLSEDSTYQSPFENNIKEQETIRADQDPLFKKVSKRLKKEIDYPDKPAKNGYPNDPPPEMVNGMHPDLVDGKKIADRFNRLDPQSAEAMPFTGNPHIDKKVKAATKKPK